MAPNRRFANQIAKVSWGSRPPLSLDIITVHSLVFNKNRAYVSVPSTTTYKYIETSLKDLPVPQFSPPPNSRTQKNREAKVTDTLKTNISMSRAQLSLLLIDMQRLLRS